MITKIYFAIWLFVGILAALLYITGNFGPITAVTFGFVVFGMVFMGMMSVLPATLAHPEAVTGEVARVPLGKRIRQYAHAVRENWVTPDIEMRNPKFH